MVIGILTVIVLIIWLFSRFFGEEKNTEAGCSGCALLILFAGLIVLTVIILISS